MTRGSVMKATRFGDPRPFAEPVRRSGARLICQTQTLRHLALALEAGAADLGYQTLVEVNPETGRASYRPGSLQQVGQEMTFCPSTGGFKSLRAMAYHPETSGNGIFVFALP